MEVEQAVELRIAQTDDRLSRLTDLLIDGAIDRKEHAERKKALHRELVTLKAERTSLADKCLSEDQIDRFLEPMKNLAELHILLEPAEKRYLAENCFSIRSVVRNKPSLEPYSWLTSRDFSELSPLVTQNGPLPELYRAKR
ncbi:MAG: hypothetical protein AAFR46_09475 [Pseudomonadota bacterium]